MTRLLIAGSGFLGEALETVFTQAGWQVDQITRTGRKQSIACDLTSHKEVASLSGKYDLIIHCASSAGGDVDAYRAIYQKGVANLLARFPETKLIFTSSTSVYPQTDHSTVTEETQLEPSSPKAQVLREAEMLTLDAGGVVVRLAGLYGKGRCHLLKQYLNSEAQIDGTGERILNFTHRADAASAMLLLAQQTGVYNVVSGSCTQREAYAALSSHYQLPMPPCVSAEVPRKRGNTSKRVSSKKLQALGWQPAYPNFLTMALACV